MESQQPSQPELSPEAVEQKMVEESQKAGIPAFQFDPDAPPSKKLEQVEAVSCYCCRLCPVAASRDIY